MLYLGPPAEGSSVSYDPGPGDGGRCFRRLCGFAEAGLRGPNDHIGFWAAVDRIDGEYFAGPIVFLAFRSSGRPAKVKPPACLAKGDRSLPPKLVGML
mmetsp:Transcript_87084/g.154073  ORF Transcript_87084/g.154073 Transcript_87084/m.154073 type:complete len:98 (+) Transcript_87084:88-381(+)